MNGVQPVALNHNVQASGTKKTTPQQQKSNVGKLAGTTTGVVGGATGAYFLNSFVNENRDTVFGYLENKLNYIAQKFPAVADEIKFFKDQGAARLNDILSKVKLGAGAALVVVPALVGLGIGAIVDFMRNRNNWTK